MTLAEVWLALFGALTLTLVRYWVEDLIEWRRNK